MAIPLRPVQKTEPSSLDVVFFFSPSLSPSFCGMRDGGRWGGCVWLCFKKAFVVRNVSRPTFVLDCIESVVQPLRIGQCTCKIPLWQR